MLFDVHKEQGSIDRYEKGDPGFLYQIRQLLLNWAIFPVL